MEAPENSPQDHLPTQLSERLVLVTPSPSAVSISCSRTSGSVARPHVWPCVLHFHRAGFPRVWVFSNPRNKAQLFLSSWDDLAACFLASISSPPTRHREGKQESRLHSGLPIIPSPQVCQHHIQTSLLQSFLVPSGKSSWRENKWLIIPGKKEIEGSVCPPDRRGRQTHLFTSKLSCSSACRTGYG